MDTSNQDPPPPIKSHLWDVFRRLKLDYKTLQSINDLAGVPAKTIDRMVLGDPVSRADAEKILRIVSQYTGSSWTFENLYIPLLATSASEEQQKPTKRLFFVELWQIHRFRADMIAPLAQVSEEVVYAMVRNAPVAKADAEKVLATISGALRQEYTLETVHVSLL